MKNIVDFNAKYFECKKCLNEGATLEYCEDVDECLDEMGHTEIFNYSVIHVYCERCGAFAGNYLPADADTEIRIAKVKKRTKKEK
jgi:hypothetical protein